MALTSAQTTKIRHFLGYPQTFRFVNPRLEGLLAPGAIDADAEALAVALLASIDDVRTKIAGVALVAGVKSLDKGDVELYAGNEQTAGMRSIGRGYVAELSSLFGVPVNVDIFGTAGNRGDGWMAGGGIPHLAGLG